MTGLDRGFSVIKKLAIVYYVVSKLLAAGTSVQKLAQACFIKYTRNIYMYYSQAKYCLHGDIKCWNIECFKENLLETRIQNNNYCTHIIIMYNMCII